jgi:hypothetical protein
MIAPMAEKPELPPVAALPPGRYRHAKTGNEYEVVGVARDSETLEELVVYRALYGPRGLWVRPLGMFTEAVDVDGRRVPRFARVGTAGEHSAPTPRASESP